MDPSSIAPGLLLAMPQLADPNFERSVVLMVEHDENQSFGLVVNRVTDIRVVDALDGTGLRWGGGSGDRVGSGGPVMPQSGWVLHSGSAATPEALRLGDDLHLSSSPDELRALAENPPRHLRFLIGYAGWGAGQLGGEMAMGAWLTAAASAQLVFETPPEDMWSAALRSIGVDPSSLVSAPGVH